MATLSQGLPQQGESDFEEAVAEEVQEALVTEAPAPPQVQPEPSKPVVSWEKIKDNCAGNGVDSVIFAYYLYLKDEYCFDESGTLTSGVHYCNRYKWKNFDERHYSLLKRMESATLYSRSTSFPIATGTSPARCSICSAADEKSKDIPCPYGVLRDILLYAKQENVSAFDVFQCLLPAGYNRPFGNWHSENLELPANRELLNRMAAGIDSESAFAAYILIRDGLTNLVNVVKDSYGMDVGLDYSALRLCNKKDKTSKVADFLAIWENPLCNMNHFKLRNLKEKINDDHCDACSYTQCPERLAAYFIYISQKLGGKPSDIAYYVATSSTFCNLSWTDNYQHSRYVDKILESNMSVQDKEELVNTVNYIMSRKENKRCPIIPMHMVFETKDVEATREFISDALLQPMWLSRYYDGQADDYNTVVVDLLSMGPGALEKQLEEYPAGKNVILTNLTEAKMANPAALVDTIHQTEGRIAVFVVDEKNALDTFFGKFPILRRKLFSRTYVYNDLTPASVADKIEEKVGSVLSIPTANRRKLERYVAETYQKSGKESSVYIQDTYRDIMFKHFSETLNASNELKDEDIPALKPKRKKEEIFDELNSLIGLANVKKALGDIADTVSYDIATNRIKNNRQSIHMAFTGNPGTGKTTVARLTAEILHSIGFIQENKLVQCSAKDLIGEYLGTTAPKTAKKCEEAYNGVLFIDEAYQLNPEKDSNGGLYKSECIAELIQQMENNSGRLVVIFAGYTEEMKAFISDANPGLKSRVPISVEFPDYNLEELLAIFDRLVKKNNIRLDSEAKEKVKAIFQEAKKSPSKLFGNARYVRNVYEQSYRTHAVRVMRSLNGNLSEADDDLVNTFTREDIVAAIQSDAHNEQYSPNR